MANDQIDRVARELVTLTGAAGLVPPFSERYPALSPEDGYRAAAQLHAARLAEGWRPVGRKIGFTNRTIWKRYGVHEPMWGMVYDRTLVAAPANRAQVPLAGLAQPRIEPEICFRLARAPGAARDAQALLGAIEWIAHSIEIVQCHHPDWVLKIADCTADNGLHGRLVIGTPIPVSTLPDLAAQLPGLRVALRRGDTV
ncbi:MAG: decarboxylase, partial [Proteobacteria bacterium]|nr:decarboxylase [Pseudomonadota bacterium]